MKPSNSRKVCNGINDDFKLEGREIEKLAQNITVKWPELASLLNLAQHEIDNLHFSLIYPNITDKAARILQLYNNKPGSSREELIECLEEIKLPQLKEMLINTHHQ